MTNYNKKQESFIFARIIIPYRKPMVNKIKIGKKSAFFTNKRDNNDKTRYLIKMEEAYLEIGRASCRERVQISVVAVSLKKKNKKTYTT